MISVSRPFPLHSIQVRQRLLLRSSDVSFALFTMMFPKSESMLTSSVVIGLSLQHKANNFTLALRSSDDNRFFSQYSTESSGRLQRSSFSIRLSLHMISSSQGLALTSSARSLFSLHSIRLSFVFLLISSSVKLFLAQLSKVISVKNSTPFRLVIFSSFSSKSQRLTLISVTLAISCAERILSEFKSSFAATIRRNVSSGKFTSLISTSPGFRPCVGVGVSVAGTGVPVTASPSIGITFPCCP